MITLNLVDLEKSDIKYKISKFPDGQQNIVITDIKCLWFPIDGKFYNQTTLNEIRERLLKI